MEEKEGTSLDEGAGISILSMKAQIVREPIITKAPKCVFDREHEADIPSNSRTLGHNRPYSEKA